MKVGFDISHHNGAVEETWFIVTFLLSRQSLMLTHFMTSFSMAFLSRSFHEGTTNPGFLHHILENDNRKDHECVRLTSQQLS